MELRPKNAKKPTKIKKEINEIRKNLETFEIIPSTSSNSHEIAVDEAAATFLKKIKFFQDRLHSKNPIKAKAHHRLIYGLREIKRDAAFLKVVIIAKDIEIYTEESELTKMVEQIVEKCKENNVPEIYALKKSKLARIFNKQRSIAAVGILDYSGAENLFNDLMEAVDPAQRTEDSRSERFLHQTSLFA